MIGKFKTGCNILLTFFFLYFTFYLMNKGRSVKVISNKIANTLNSWYKHYEIIFVYILA